MIALRKNHPCRYRRGGATIVESALLMSIFLLFLFGILEYCRYILMVHVTTNAARDAARYASVHVNKTATFDYIDTTVAGVRYESIWEHTTMRMGGTDQMIKNMLVAAYPCDTAQLYGTSPNYTPTIAPKSGFVRPALTNYTNKTTVTRTTDWNEATFGERIAVEVTGTYSPVLPNFLFMDGFTNVKIIVLMGSEG